VFHRQIFEKFSTFNFHAYPSSVSRVFSLMANGRTDRHDEADNHISQFFGRV